MANKKFVGVLLALVMLISLGATTVLAQPGNGNSMKNESNHSGLALGITNKINNMMSKYAQKLEDAQARFAAQAQKFENAKNNWMSARQNFQKNKNRDANALFPVAQNYLLNATDRLSNYLEVNRARVLQIDSNTGIDTNALVAKIDAQLDDLNSLKPQIMDANSTASLQALLPQVNSVWDSAKALSKETVGYILADNTSRLVDKVNSLSAAINTKIASFDANGLDTNAAKSAMNDFNTQITNARNDVLNSITAFNQITSSANVQQFFKQGQDYLQQAHNDLRNASKGLKNAARDLISVQNNTPNDQNITVNDENEGNNNHDLNETNHDINEGINDQNSNTNGSN